MGRELVALTNWMKKEETAGSKIAANQDKRGRKVQGD